MENSTIRPDYYSSMPIEPHLIAEQESSYNVGTAIVYLMRAGKKGSAIEDYKKAITHLEFEKEIKEFDNDSLNLYSHYPVDIASSIYDLIAMNDKIAYASYNKNELIDKVIMKIQDEIKKLEEVNNDN